MGTDEEHRRHGLARHVLTAGQDSLALLGAQRLKINYENDNPASTHLYQDAGFSPAMTTSLHIRDQPHN
jgi:RimJ/RimL family protein N-acetyltransferase